MLSIDSYKNLLFLDIETVPNQPSFNDLDDEWKTLWEKKSQYYRAKEDVDLEESYERAGLYAEFAKVVCISLGVIVYEQGPKKLRIKSFCWSDESSHH